MHTLKIAAVAAAVTGLVLGLAAPANAVGETPDSRPICEASWQFDPSSHRTDQVVWDRSIAINNSPAPITWRFSAHKTGTVKYSAGISGGGDATVVLATIKYEINADVEKSLSGWIGQSSSGTLAPGKTIRGAYGAFREVVHGHHWYQTRTCGKVRSTWITATAPYATGWKVT